MFAGIFFLGGGGSESPFCRLSVDLQHEICKLFKLSKHNFPHNSRPGKRHLIFSLKTIHPKFKNNNTSTNKVETTRCAAHTTRPYSTVTVRDPVVTFDLFVPTKGSPSLCTQCSRPPHVIHGPRPQNHTGQFTPEGQKYLWAAKTTSLPSTS